MRKRKLITVAIDSPAAAGAGIKKLLPNIIIFTP